MSRVGQVGQDRPGRVGAGHRHGLLLQGLADLLGPGGMAPAALAEYNDQLNSAREEAAKIREEAKNTGAQMLAEARERASKESDRILAAGRAQLEAERAQLLAELRGDIGGLAATLAGRIVGEVLTDDERANRTIDRFLQELETAGTSR